MSRTFLTNEEVFRLSLESMGSHGVNNPAENQWGKVINRRITRKDSYVTVAERSGFDLLQQRNPGVDAPIMEEIFKTKRLNVQRFAGGYKVSEHEIESDVNRVVAQKGALLQVAVKNTMQAVLERDMLRLAAASNPITSIIDGKAVFATDHTIKGGTQSNLLTGPIDYYTIERLLTTADTQFNIKGIPAPDVTQGYDLHVSSNAYRQIQRILESDMVAGGMNNDKNMVRNDIKEVIQHKWWGQSTANDSTMMLMPHNPAERAMLLWVLKMPTVKKDERVAAELVYWYASMWFGFDATHHYNHAMSQA